MIDEYNPNPNPNPNPNSQLKSKDVEIIDESARNRLIEQAKSCLAWAHDPARTVVPGAENMTKDQVRVGVRVVRFWVRVTTNDQVGDDLWRDWVCLGTPQQLMLICLCL